MPSSTVEDYIKRLYTKEQGRPEHLVPMGELAAAMGVAPGTATAMIKTLSSAGLVDYTPRTGVRLSDGGRQLALHVLRRHRLVELLLVEVLGLDWTEVHEEAEALEHVISDRVLEQIDRLLNHPDTDPHGDPIPSAQGAIPAPEAKGLVNAQEGERLCVSRVLDQNPEFLNFAHAHLLVPGSELRVIQRDDAAEAIMVCVKDSEPFTLGFAAAAKVLVQRDFPMARG